MERMFCGDFAKRLKNPNCWLLTAVRSSVSLSTISRKAVLVVTHQPKSNENTDASLLVE